MSFFEKYINSRFYSVIEIIFRIVILNLIFIAFSVMGLIVFSIFPAFIALVIIIKDVFRESNFETMKIFVTAFKKNYLKAEILFLIFLVVGFLIMYNTYYFYQGLTQINDTFHIIGFSFSLIIDLFFIITIFQSILIIIYFPELNLMKTIKYSVLFTIYYLPKNILLLISTIVILILTYLLYLIPMMFFTFSLLGYILVMIFKIEFDDLKKDVGTTQSLENYIQQLRQTK